MKLYKYTFSDRSVIIDDVCAIKAVQHQYCNPGIELLNVEVYRVDQMPVDQIVSGHFIS